MYCACVPKPSLLTNNEQDHQEIDLPILDEIEELFHEEDPLQPKQREPWEGESAIALDVKEQTGKEQEEAAKLVQDLEKLVQDLELRDNAEQQLQQKTDIIVTEAQTRIYITEQGCHYIHDCAICLKSIDGRPDFKVFI